MSGSGELLSHVNRERGKGCGNFELGTYNAFVFGDKRTNQDLLVCL